jgi:oligopeptide transport system substrate-binding protein
MYKRAIFWKRVLAGMILLTIITAGSFAPVTGFSEESFQHQQSKTGPIPPVEVIQHDSLKVADRAEDILSQVVLPVPAYAWRHGCGPTALGMLLGYYDSNGFADLVSGSALTQTDAVNQMIASGGNTDSPNLPGTEHHFEDYALPIDNYPNMLPDNYLASGRIVHAADSLADFMKTSESTAGNYYGWSWSKDVGPAFASYVKRQNPGYNPTYQLYYSTSLTWSRLTSEIDAGHPMVFLVDTNGDDSSDHFVPVIGYRTSPTLQYASWDTWSTTTVRWQNFKEMESGVSWGIWGGWTFRIEQLAAKNTLNINAETVPTLLDPQKATFTDSIGHLKLIYEGLTRLNTSSYTMPAAAQSWMFSRDGLQLFFNLRSGLQYSDGSLLNAKRFEYAILRAIDPTVASEYAPLFDRITGAVAYRNANPAALPPEALAALRAQVQVKAYDTESNLCSSYDQVNCRTLWVGFTTPAFDFPMVVSTSLVAPVKEELINSGGADWWQTLGNLTGNGPFILTSLNVDGHSNFVPNPHYWRGVPNYNVSYAYFSDPAEAYLEYKNGNLDITVTTPALVETGLLSQYHSYAGNCTYAIHFHNAMEPFTDPKIRAAFAYAFDREAWVRDVFGGSGIPTLTWIPPGMPGYQGDETRWGYDPLKANQALAESTYGSADKLPQITIYYAESTVDTVRWQWLVNQWETVLGVDITLTQVPAGDPVPDSMIYVMGWCGDYPDQSNYLSTYWHTGGFAQQIGFSNAAIDALLDRADVEMDATTRASLYAQAQDLLVQNIPVAFGWNNLNAYLVKPRVRGIQSATFDTIWIGDTDPMLIWVADNSTIYTPILRR